MMNKSEIRALKRLLVEHGGVAGLLGKLDEVRETYLWFCALWYLGVQ